MNFLAHAYLSFEIPEIVVGNLITDFMPGYEKDNFPKEIQNGIALHHEIDYFTDQHPTTHQANEYLRPASGRYCGVFMDIIYDHFLASDKTIFPGHTLATYSQKIYKILDTYYNLLPKKFQHVFYHMKKEDWLYHYHTTKGTNNAFGGIYHRARYLEKNNEVYKAFILHYDAFQEAYNHFMPEMIHQAKTFLAERGLYNY